MVKLRTAGALALAGVVALAQTFGIARGYAAGADRWVGWAEIGGALGGKNEDRAEAAVFLPLIQSNKGLFFTDVRGKLFEEQVSEINAAFGYRHMLDGGLNVGAWVGADRRDTSQDNIFWATSGGIELLSENIDLRLNGYLAVTDPKGSAGLASAVIENGQVFLIGGQEVPLSGVDGEVGVRIPIEYLGADTDRHRLRAYAGGFFFDDDDALEEVAGPKARIEWRIDDVLAAVPGSLLAFETEWRSDKVRGGHVEAGLRFRLPFSIFNNVGVRASDKPVQWRRMIDGLERDTDIITARSEREGVEDLLTGVDFDRAVTVDATTGVTAPAASAGSNSLLVADGAGGAIVGAQVVQPNQTVLGGGGSVQVRGLKSGTVATLTAPGQRPTFANPLNTATLTLADRTHLASVDVTGSTLNVFNDGVSIDTSQFVVLQDLSISGVGGAGIDALNGNTLDLRNVRVTNAPLGPGLALNNGNSVTVSNSQFDATFFGVFANDSNVITLTDTTIANICADGIRIDDDNRLTLTRVGVSNLCGDAVAFDNRNTVIVGDSSFSNIGFGALFGFDDNVVTVSNTSVDLIGADLVAVRDGNTIGLSNVTGTRLIGRGVLINDNNNVTIANSSMMSALEGIDTNDFNTLTLTDSTIISVGGEEGIDISDGNVLTVSGSTISSDGNNALEMTVGNQVTVNMSVLTGTPTNTIRFDGAGNLVSGSGNTDTSAPTVAFCSDIGGQVGSISFTNGTSCP